jgi:hypothetical protein
MSIISCLHTSSLTLDRSTVVEVCPGRVITRKSLTNGCEVSRHPGTVERFVIIGYWTGRICQGLPAGGEIIKIKKISE